MIIMIMSIYIRYQLITSCLCARIIAVAKSPEQKTSTGLKKKKKKKGKKEKKSYPLSEILVFTEFRKFVVMCVIHHSK